MTESYDWKQDGSACRLFRVVTDQGGATESTELAAACRGRTTYWMERLDPYSYSNSQVVESPTLLHAMIDAELHFRGIPWVSEDLRHSAYLLGGALSLYYYDLLKSGTVEYKPLGVTFNVYCETREGVGQALQHWLYALAAFAKGEHFPLRSIS